MSALGTFQSVVGMPAKGRKRTFELYSITPTSALWTFMPKRLLVIGDDGTVFRVRRWFLYLG